MRLVVDANVLFSFFKNEKRLKKIEKYGIKAFSTSDLISFLPQT